MQSFKREVLIWKHLEHENILPLFGITLIDGVPSTVSEWMENGNVIEFLTKNDNVDRLEMVRISAFVMKAVLISRPRQWE